MNPVINNLVAKPALTDADIENSNQLYARAMEFARDGRFHNLPEARRLLLESAKKGNANAMDKLGLMFQYGLGGILDLKIAGKLYNQAIRLGHSGAHLNLKCLNEFVTIVFGEYSFQGLDK